MEGHGNRASGKRFKSVLEKRLEALQALEKVADALITEAITGNIAAIKEIGDRLDGKAKQQTEVTGLDDSPLFRAVEIKLTRPNASS